MRGGTDMPPKGKQLKVVKPDYFDTPIHAVSPAAPTSVWRNKGKFTLAAGTLGGAAILTHHYRKPKEDAVKSDVIKFGEWKTIDQREDSRNKARKTKRRGEAAVVLGGGAAGGAYYAGQGKGPGLFGGEHFRTNQAWHEALNLKQIAGGKQAHFTLSDAGRPPVKVTHDLSRMSRVKRVGQAIPKNKLGATLIGGTTLAQLGAAGYVQGRTREAYHQHKINQRRRSNSSRVITAKSYGGTMIIENPFDGQRYEVSKAVAALGPATHIANVATPELSGSGDGLKLHHVRGKGTAPRRTESQHYTNSSATNRRVTSLKVVGHGKV